MLEILQLSVALDGKFILRDVHLTVRAGERVAILGPSGSGKTTLLRAIAGLLAPTAGTISWQGEILNDVPTHLRNIGMVFQEDQLFPHLTVAGNIAFALKIAGVPRHECAVRVAELLQLIGLNGFEQRRVNNLSGGEAKRVAVARSLAPLPRVLLLDEPLTGLDTELHDRLLSDLRALFIATNTTVIAVTHNRDEATALCDRVVNLSDLQHHDK